MELQNEKVQNYEAIFTVLLVPKLCDMSPSDVLSRVISYRFLVLSCLDFQRPITLAMEQVTSQVSTVSTFSALRRILIGTLARVPSVLACFGPCSIF